MTTNTLWEQIEPKLDPKLLACLKDQFKFEHTMPVQQAAIPLFLKNYDVAVEAQTGSGKTLSFLIPVFQGLIKKQKEITKTDLFALVVAPSRELAQQIGEVALNFGNTLGFQVQVCIGGYGQDVDIEKIIKSGCNVLIGSPGKLRQIFEDKRFGDELRIKCLEYLIFGINWSFNKSLQQMKPIDQQVMNIGVISNIFLKNSRNKEERDCFPLH